MGFSQNTSPRPRTDSFIRVKLYSGKVVEAEITPITTQSAGRKVQIVYGSVTASINPAQIIEVLVLT